VKYYNNLKWLFFIFLWCQSWIFQHHFSRLPCHMILQKSYESIWFVAQETFLIIIVYFFRILWWIVSSKEQQSFEIVWNNVKLFIFFIYISLLNLAILLIWLHWGCCMRTEFSWTITTLFSSALYRLNKLN